jgi:diadenosine tetraphosphate (Ap4A) HIT family hydrolase
MTAAECTICAMVADEPAAGWTYADESWVAGVLPGLEVPGWIVLALRRHSVETAPLSEREGSGLGVAISRLSAALAEVTDAERVYLQAYGEREPHWHLLLTARGPEVAPEHRHVAFFTHREEYVDVEEAHHVVDRLRRVMSADRSEAVR